MIHCHLHVKKLSSLFLVFYLCFSYFNNKRKSSFNSYCSLTIKYRTSITRDPLLDHLLVLGLKGRERLPFSKVALTSLYYELIPMFFMLLFTVFTFFKVMAHVIFN